MLVRTSIVALALTCLVPGSALAQFDNRGGLFAPLLMLFGGGQSMRREEPSRYHGDFAPSRNLPQVTVRPRAIIEEEEDERSERALGPRAFCVRLCDGFYFPVGPAVGGRTAQAQSSACSRMCPAAEVAIYSLPKGGEVGDAIGPSGQRYASLDRAFRFRSELSTSCTCNGRPGGGLAPVDLSDDFTLRRGDLIAGENGPLVFAGGGRLPFKSAQFTPIGSRQLGREMMRRLVRSSSAPISPIAASSPLGSSNAAELSDEPAKPAGVVRVVPLGTTVTAAR